MSSTIPTLSLQSYIIDSAEESDLKWYIIRISFERVLRNIQKNLLLIRTPFLTLYHWKQIYCDYFDQDHVLIVIWLDYETT
jgi:hypothetical protein